MSENTCNSLTQEIISSHDVLFDALSGYIETGSDGSVRYRNGNGQYHRTNGPAIIFTDGTELWYLNGIYLREEEIKTLTETGLETVLNLIGALEDR